MIHNASRLCCTEQLTASILYQQGYRPCEYPLPPGLPGPVIVVPV